MTLRSGKKRRAPTISPPRSARKKKHRIVADNGPSTASLGTPRRSSRIRERTGGVKSKTIRTWQTVTYVKTAGSVQVIPEDADSRDHHIFISVGKDGYERLGRERFETPIGRITEGLEVLDDLYYGYGELPELYHRLRLEGNGKIEKEYPKLSKIKYCTEVSEESSEFDEL